MNLSRKHRFFILLSCIILVIFLHRLFVYNPPLLDNGKRDILENAFDFFSFAWNLTKASLKKDYFGKSGEANEDFVKAGWYRRKYLIKRLRITDKDLELFLEKNKGLTQEDLKEALYDFAMFDSRKLRDR